MNVFKAKLVYRHEWFRNKPSRRQRLLNKGGQEHAKYADDAMITPPNVPYSNRAQLKMQ